MFEFDPIARYMMPAHFGVPVLKQQPTGWYRDVTTMNVQYLTDRKQLQALLPTPFRVADEALVTVTYACSKKVDWLAGRGYNLISVNAAVVFEGDQEVLEGSFALVVWENLADPILSGREMTGIPKIFADIDDHTISDGAWHCRASHFGSAIVDLSICNLTTPTAEQIAAAQAEKEGKDNPMAWRYIPAVGGFGAALSEPTIYPSENVITEAQIGEGRIEWHRLTWEQNPTQFHIVNKLADLPILEYRPAIVTKGSTNLLLPERWPRALAPSANRTIKEIQKVCYVGAGTMGCANALVAAISGYDVVLYDPQAESLAQVPARHIEMGAYLVSMGYCSPSELAASAARVTCSDDLAAAVKDADLVSESVIEDLAVKRSVHEELDRICPPNTILTTNTSGMLVSEIEDVVERGDRFAALHSHLGTFLIDIVGGPRTSASTIDILKRYVKSAKCMPLVLKKENSGYVLNAILGPLVTTGVMLEIDGVATREEVDRAWMKGQNAPMGPFGMVDLFGLNVVYDGWLHQEPDDTIEALRPKLLNLLKPYVERGELGTKTGKGFYTYPNPTFEQDGFLDEAVNEAARLALTTMVIGKAIILAAKGVAEPADIDRAWKVGMHLGTGPFEMLGQLPPGAIMQMIDAQPGILRPVDIELIKDFLRTTEPGEVVNR